jgi:transposase
MTPAPSLPSLDDIEAVRRKLIALAAEGRTAELIELVIELLIELRNTNTAQAARLTSALRELYGRKSQKVSAEQLNLMLSTLPDQDPANRPPAPAPSDESAPPPPAEGSGSEPPERRKRRRDRGGRSPLPKELPREVRVVSVPERGRICERCGAEKACIGHRTSEILEFVPAYFRVIEEKREKRACLACPEEGVVTAPSEKVMDRGRPGPGLLAHLVVSKLEDSTPLYRQSQQYQRVGVSLSPSTLGDWSAFALDQLAPVADRLFELAVGSFYLHIDDTGMRVLDRKHPKGVKRGHIWAFVGHVDADTKVVAHRYTPDWKATRPASLLVGFHGVMQGDGYAGYEAMVNGDDKPVVPEERRLGCGMHIRAKFENATKTGDLRAAVALSYFKRIYRIEAECKQQQLSPEARRQGREALSIPIVDELYQWVEKLHPQLVPKSPLYVATYYALSQEASWRRCFADGRFEIDNGEAERNQRRIALGRKSYLFAGSDNGAVRLAVGYTVLGSCRLSGVKPLEWATDVLAKLQAGWPKSRLDELLPHVWVTNRPVAD